MEFDVYNCQCIALSDDQAFSAEDAPVKKERLELIDQILTADKQDYPVAARMGVLFKEGNLLRLIRKQVRRRTRVSNPMQAEQTWPYLKALICYAREGFYVMRVQNQTMFSEEDEWEEDDDFNGPSCWVILANLPDRQLLLVEENSAFDATISRSTQTVADIFEDTLKALLNPYQLDVHICPYESLDKCSEISCQEDEEVLFMDVYSPFRPDRLRMALDAEVFIALAKDVDASSPKTKSAMEKFRENVEEQIKSWPDRLTPKA